MVLTLGVTCPTITIVSVEFRVAMIKEFVTVAMVLAAYLVRLGVKLDAA